MHDDIPFTFAIALPEGIPQLSDDRCSRTLRRLSHMRGQFADWRTYEELLACEDRLIYEVYEIGRPQIKGELLHGTSIVHPGKVGGEYHMTKGHFHAVLDSAEIYYCLQGQGMLVMENPEGRWAVEELAPGHVLYVPPRWAHRSVNTSLQEDLVTLFVYPGDAGHNYGDIERRGFRKLVVEKAGRPEIVDNPRWREEG